jgi:hypothetical protein
LGCREDVTSVLFSVDHRYIEVGKMELKIVPIVFVCVAGGGVVNAYCEEKEPKFLLFPDD